MLFIKFIYWMTMVIFIGLPICIATLVFLSKRKGSRMGINFSKVNCPKCGNAMPAVRFPKNFRQFMWGGGTCYACGCEMDKWGKLL